MIKNLKKILYFRIAAYFAFFAKIQLIFWKPRIVVITGSNGKTTALHLAKAQLGIKAKYSERANSSFGIPFDILGLKRRSFRPMEWPVLFLLAPIKAFHPAYKEKIYIVEADCDRPGEGAFLSNLLKPECCIWISSDRTHSMNFDKLISAKKFKDVDQAIANEYFNFIKASTSLVIANSDNQLIDNYLDQIRVPVTRVSLKTCTRYEITAQGTEYSFESKKIVLPYLLPSKNFYAIYSVIKLMEYLDEKIDYTFERFTMPPGRSSLLKGIKETNIIDSSYNANFSSVEAVLDMFQRFPAKEKWLVLGDMTEQGEGEEKEHAKLVSIIKKLNLQKVILVGPRLRDYTYTAIDQNKALSFLNPDEAAQYIKENIVGGETLLFKGARFLEGIVEQILADKSDSKYLCRRENIWSNRRKKWGM